MKKLFLGAIVLGLFSTSCKSDNNGSSDAALLIGTWKYSKYVTYSGKDGSILHSELVTGCETQDNIEFRSDKTFTDRYYNSGTNGSCALGGADNGTYTFNEGTKEIVVKYTNGNTDYSKIQTISSSYMEVSQTINDENSDGYPERSVAYLYK